jgi:hypothetical protein
MVVDRIKHTKPPAKRSFMDELEPIPYTISPSEIAALPPRIREILFGSQDIAEALGNKPSAVEVVNEPLADLPFVAFPHINLLVPEDATNEKLNQLKIEAPANQAFEIEQKSMHISRYAKQDADQLLKIMAALQEDQEMTLIISKKNEDDESDLWEEVAHLYRNLQCKE